MFLKSFFTHPILLVTDNTLILEHCRPSYEQASTKTSLLKQQAQNTCF
eukprot:Gb_05498 [translate_table: standard]